VALVSHGTNIEVNVLEWPVHTNLGSLQCTNDACTIQYMYIHGNTNATRLGYVSTTLHSH